MLRLALVAVVVASAALAADGGSSIDGGSSTAARSVTPLPASSTPARSVTPLPASGHPPPSGEGVDGGAFPHYTGGSHCKMVRTGDNAVLAERTSAGSILDCQEEVRAEVRAKQCKQSRQRIDVSFIGDWNGIASEPVQTRINCPKK